MCPHGERAGADPECASFSSTGSILLALGDAPVAGEIGVGAYVTEAAPDKLMRHGRGLVGAVFQDQPAVTLQVIRCRVDNLPQRCEPFGAGGESYLGLVLQRCALQGSVTFRHIRRIAGDQIKPPARQRAKPPALEKLDAT